MTRRGRITLAAFAAAATVLSTAAFRMARSGAPFVAGHEIVALAAPPAALPTPGLPPEIAERLPVTRDTLERAAHSALESPGGGRVIELVPLADPGPGLVGPLRVEYTLHAELSRDVFEVLRRARVALGHVILLDAWNGRVLAYASTDVARFPPTRAYPAASLVKVITAAAALDRDPKKAQLPCRYRGSPYRLTRSRIDPPSRGVTVSLRRALATSNNQCFAQLAVHAVGGGPLVEAIARFGWLAAPAPAHAAGSVETSEDRYDVGRLGCGLAGCRITPLHGAQLAAALARGERVAPHWIERVVDAHGRELPVPAFAAPRRVMSAELADDLRAMLVDTTVRGTARSAFRRRNGRPLLGPVQVAGKTGSLSGADPKGRYEWFIGVAPADEPRVAVAVLLVQGHLWWRNASQVAGEVLRGVFCAEGGCGADRATRWLRPPEPPEAPTRSASVRPAADRRPDPLLPRG